MSIDHIIVAAFLLLVAVSFGAAALAKKNTAAGRLIGFGGVLLSLLMFYLQVAG